MKLSDCIIPLIFAFILIYGVYKKVDVFDEFIAGAMDNLKVGVQILPTLIALVTCIGVFKASGAIDIITDLVEPVTQKLGFPSECVSLAVLRPISGSGAIAMYETILQDNGPDSYIGRVASVLLGASETTFYTIAVFFSVTSVKKTRHTVVASLAGDLTGFVFSAIFVQMFMP